MTPIFDVTGVCVGWLDRHSIVDERAIIVRS